MFNGRLWTGDTFQAGELGHMILIPGGRRCYCGKQGCADAYLSPRALKRDGWETYLDHLAVFITNLRMLLNMDLVIGAKSEAKSARGWMHWLLKLPDMISSRGISTTFSPVSGRNTAARWAPPNLGWSSLEIKCSDVFSACKADDAARERYR